MAVKHDMDSLEQEVKTSLINGNFKSFARAYIFDSVGLDIKNLRDRHTYRELKHRELWTAVHNVSETVRFDLAQDLYGSEKRFLNHGMESLVSEELRGITGAVNIALTKCARAHDYLIGEDRKLEAKKQLRGY